MQILGLIWGILAIIGMFVATIPFLGWLNWGNIPFSFIGLIINCIAVAIAKGSRATGIAGIVLCCIAIIWGVLRLKAGWGIL
jgi:hypothetical protein